MKHFITLFIICIISPMLLLSQNQTSSSLSSHHLKIAERPGDLEKPDITQTKRIRLAKYLKRRDINKLKHSTQELKMGLDSLLTEVDISGDQYWMNETKTDAEYDLNGNNTTQNYYSWDFEFEVWELIAKYYDMVYNENGDLTLAIVDLSDPEFGEMHIKGEFSYKPNGEPFQEITYFWNPDIEEWIANNMDEYVYDESGTLLYILGYYWDVYLSEWDLSWKEEFTYDANNNIINSTNYHYSGNDTWSPDDKTDYSYDGNNFLTQEIFYNWDYINSGWLENEKLEYLYDVYQNLSVVTYLLWNTDLSSWDNFYKDTFEYNNDYSSDDILLPVFWIGSDYEVGAFGHMVTSYLVYFWDADNEQWVTETKGTLYYSEHLVTDVPTTAVEELKIFPNPATDYFFISSKDKLRNATIELYDVNGKLVVQQALSENQQISVSHLEKGFYIYKILEAGEMRSGKIIIK